MKSLVDNDIRINKKTGLYEPIWWKRAAFPYQLTFDPQYTPTGVLVVPAAGNAISVFKEPHTGQSLDGGYGTPLSIRQSTFEDSTSGTAAANFTVFLKDLGDMTQFMNAPVHIQNFAGTAQLAARFSEPLFLPTLHALQATYAMLAGGPDSIRHFLGGISYAPWSTEIMNHPGDKAALLNMLRKLTERRKYIFPFWLTTNVNVVVPANGTSEHDVQIGDDGHFEMTHLVGVPNGVIAGSGTYQVNVLNPDTKQSFTNGKIASTAAVGTAQNPQELAVPWLIPAGKRLRFQFTDTSGASNNIFFAIRGRRIRALLKSGDDVAALMKGITQVKQDLRIPKAMVQR